MAAWKLSVPMPPNSYVRRRKSAEFIERRDGKLR
jgi:hypothetical protein